MSSVRRVLVLVLSCALGLGLAPGPAGAAAAAGGFVDGTDERSTITNCASVINGSPYDEDGAAAFTGVYRDTTSTPPEPTVGQSVYMRIVVYGLGFSCAGQRFLPAVSLPAGVGFDRSLPILCGSDRVRYTDCPQWSNVVAFPYVVGAQAYRSTDTGAAQTWPLEQGRVWDFRFPIRSSTAQTAATLQAHVKMFDGNRSPLLHPRAPLYVFPAGTAATWQRLPGSGRDVGAGRDGAWLVGRTAVGGGSSIHRWTGSAWTTVPGGALSIDAAPGGGAWIVNSTGAVYRRTATGWQRLPGAGREVGVGADGTAWLLGRTPVAGGYPIYRWAGSSWARVPGSAVALDVDQAGRAWIVNASGAVYRRSGTSWQRLPGAGRTVGVGADGTAWLVGRTPVAGGSSLHRWTGSGWVTVPGGAVEVDVDGQGRPWIVTDAGAVLRRSTKG